MKGGYILTTIAILCCYPMEAVLAWPLKLVPPPDLMPRSTPTNIKYLPNVGRKMVAPSPLPVTVKDSPTIKPLPINQVENAIERNGAAASIAPVATPPVTVVKPIPKILLSPPTTSPKTSLSTSPTAKQDLPDVRMKRIDSVAGTQAPVIPAVIPPPPPPPPNTSTQISTQVKPQESTQKTIPQPVTPPPPPVANTQTQGSTPTVQPTPVPLSTPPLPTPHSPLPTEKNNPLAAPQNLDELLKLRMTMDIWTAMYSPLSCLDVTPDCIQRLQQEAVQNSPVIRELEEKISTINSKIDQAKTNNKKSIDLSVFEPALQAFLRQDTVVKNGQTQKIGFFDRVGQLFTNPGPVLNEILAGVGIPLLQQAYGGGSEAQQAREIQLTDLAAKVAEIDRGKMEVVIKTREKVQQLVLDFDLYAREFQGEQAMAKEEEKSFKLYAVTYGLGDGDTNTYLNRKGQVERAKLGVYKSWARVRGQIISIKSFVMPKEN